MLLKNKKTGEIGWLYCDHISIPKKMTVFAEGKDLSANHWDYKTLAELNKEWCDYEEPKDFWFIDPEILIACESTDPLLCDKKVAIETMKQIGNYFDSREEAEKAVEKLKAWKRLKDKGFRFEYYDYSDRDLHNHIQIKAITNREVEDSMLCKEDLDLLFSQEDD